VIVRDSNAECIAALSEKITMDAEVLAIQRAMVLLLKKKKKGNGFCKRDWHLRLDHGRLATADARGTMHGTFNSSSFGHLILDVQKEETSFRSVVFNVIPQECNVLAKVLANAGTDLYIANIWPEESLGIYCKTPPC
jgi:hypothetical protein